MIPPPGPPAADHTGTGRHRGNNGIKNVAGSCSGSQLLIPNPLTKSTQAGTK
jgi:hypothetical protein